RMGPTEAPDLTHWKELVSRIERTMSASEQDSAQTGALKIGLIGKYVRLPDAYLSVVEALKHASFAHETPAEIVWIPSDTLETDDLQQTLGYLDGILVPGGFGVRGIEGKVQAVRWAREQQVPFLGLCLGLQCAVIEFARNVAGLEGANSTEFDSSTEYPVIDILAGQDLGSLGGTMRLGAYPCRLTPGSNAARAYGRELIYERHRHRYEVNPRWRTRLERAGLVASGESPDGTLVEMIELADHPWFVGTQFHPEFKSRPDRPHPLFHDFIGAAIERRGPSEPAIGPVSAHDLK
ncbi:MAG TPA: CTP synthase, partial [Actinomycetota bacterium]|nr:CTP synthase [Actinomycetota bacterium]